MFILPPSQIIVKFIVFARFPHTIYILEVECSLVHLHVRTRQPALFTTIPRLNQRNQLSKQHETYLDPILWPFTLRRRHKPRLNFFSWLAGELGEPV